MKPGTPATAAGSPAAVRPKHSFRKKLLRVVVVVAVALGLWIVATAYYIAQHVGDESQPADVIVVFGAAEYAGRPSPVWKARLDHAYELYERGIAPVVIATGGFGSDPHFSEGGVGRDYLSRRGVPDSSLIAETQSDDTAESAKRVAAIMRANHWRTAVAVSDAYHLFRVKRFLERQGVVAYSSPRPDSVPKTRSARAIAALREAVSLTYWRIVPMGSW
jgi:uncharacterized SAM-binding protein YcdF (DUF218 family)